MCRRCFCCHLPREKVALRDFWRRALQREGSTAPVPVLSLLIGAAPTGPAYRAGAVALPLSRWGLRKPPSLTRCCWSGSSAAAYVALGGSRARTSSSKRAAPRRLKSWLWCEHLSLGKDNNRMKTYLTSRYTCKQKIYTIDCSHTWPAECSMGSPQHSCTRNQ